MLLRIVDDGVGFDMKKEQSNKAGSYGLNNIRERVVGMGVQLKLLVLKGGNRREIKVPVIKEETASDQSNVSG